MFFRDYDEPCLETLPPWTTFKFNMSALTALLKRQAEKNPTASYFNVDILKYQVCISFLHLHEKIKASFSWLCYNP